MTSQSAYGELSEVTWQSTAAIHGTLVIPFGHGPFPAVVMVAGSGPTNRDWTSPLLPGSNGSALLLAEALAQSGIASLRYDKLASDPQVRENWQAFIGAFSMQSHLDELAGAVRTLAAQSGIKADRIFALTNSEGALHALNYQIYDPTPPFAGLVLTAPPGRTVGAVARSQVAAQLTSLPNGNDLLAAYDAAIARFVAGESVAPDPALPEGMRMLLQGLASPVNLPFARELWTADAAALLKQVNVPVLVIIGKKDIQVDWQADGDLLQRAAAGHPDVTFLFPENANHVLKYEPRPRSELFAADVAAGYNSPDAHLDPEVQSATLEWLAVHA